MMETDSTSKANIDFLHVRLPFPWKLHQLLDDVENDGNDHIVSWLSDGKGFKVHRPTDFTKLILHSYFRQTKYKSFTGQLYIYGFLRVQHGNNRGAFVHPKFMRGKQQLCLSMERNQSDSSKAKVQSNVSTLEEAQLEGTIKIGSQRLLADPIQPIKLCIDEEMPQNSSKMRKNSLPKMNIAQSRRSIVDFLCKGSDSMESNSYICQSPTRGSLSGEAAPLRSADDEHELCCAQATDHEWQYDLPSLLNHCKFVTSENTIFDFEPRTIEEMMRDSETKLHSGASWNSII